MMLSNQLLFTVAHSVDEVAIHLDDVAIKIEFDNRHGAVDGAQNTCLFLLPFDIIGHIRRYFDNAHHLTRCIAHGDIARFQPDLITGRLEALKAITAAFAPSQALPKPPVGRAAAVLLAAENTVMSSDQLFAVIAHHLAERSTDIKNFTLRRKLDQRYVSVQCTQGFLLAGDLSLGLEQG